MINKKKPREAYSDSDDSEEDSSFRGYISSILILLELKVRSLVLIRILTRDQVVHQVNQASRANLIRLK